MYRGRSNDLTFKIKIHCRVMSKTYYGSQIPPPLQISAAWSFLLPTKKKLAAAQNKIKNWEFSHQNWEQNVIFDWGWGR